ncbi:P1 family peptidase [Fodinicola feengrottensis]|uniref:P1 family peptidase n=1 Tax=Fodinicola feengrottensis TaxID=435914 RepID=UPI002441FCE9|nr:P1 family peptidase [Fodinicola feengrottensis]
MVCHDFKGGIGTSSRVVSTVDGPVTVGVLVQANHGIRKRLSILGVPVGEVVDSSVVPVPEMPEAPGVHGAGSIITVVATDAPLSARQCTRLAQRATLAIGRTGGAGENDSGDGVIAFSTAGAGVIPSAGYARQRAGSYQVDVLSDDAIDALFYAVIDATEEAILNAMLAARTMTGRDGVVVHKLPAEVLLRTLADFRRGPLG